MIRTRTRQDGTPAYSFVMRTIKEYEKQRRVYVSKFYNAVRPNTDPIRGKNWAHFVRCAKLIADLNITPEDFMSAVFAQSTKTSYPRPTNLYSKASKAKAMCWSKEDLETSLIETNEIWLANIQYRNPEISIETIVLIPWFDFSAWFRMYHGTLGNINPKYAQRAHELASDEFLLEIESRGYDPDLLKYKINKVLND